MYRKILVALDNSRADDSLIPHVAQLAALVGAELLLIHVADGFAARHFDDLKLAESEEMRTDRAYLQTRADALTVQGLRVGIHLAMGNPPAEILKAADSNACDLIAMTTHGHRFLQDLFYGSTITAVRHKSQVPVLLVRAAEI